MREEDKIRIKYVSLTFANHQTHQVLERRRDKILFVGQHVEVYCFVEDDAQLHQELKINGDSGGLVDLQRI